MAKKQGVSYAPNSSLIQGAATAYRNYDNAPGMYSGLDKVVEQGGKIFEEQMEKRRVVEKKFDDASEGVLMRSGALGKTLYGTATEDAKKFRKLYIEGINTRDPNKKMEAMVALQNLSLFVQDHKQTNLDIAESRKNKELSSYYEDSPAGRKKAEIMTQIQDQKYSKVSENEEGQKQFHVMVDGEEILVTNKEYKEMASTIRNYTTGNTYMTALEKARKLEIFGEDQFRQTVKQKLPRDNDEFDATVYDGVIGGRNFIDMLNDSKTLDQEIISAIDPKAWDADADGVLDPEEKANFIDAVVNTENDFFNLKTSNQILEDQLTNAGRNSHTKHWEDENKKRQEILNRKTNSGRGAGSGDDDINKFGYNNTTTKYTMQDKGGQATYVNGRDIANAVETYKKVQEKGSGIFTGYDDTPHMLKNGKWFKYNDETTKFDIPSNANSIFTSLKWNNNPRIMEYLKENPDKNKDGIPDVLMDKDNYAKKYTTFKPRTYRYYNSNDAKKGIGIEGKYYEDKDNDVRYQFKDGKYIKVK